MSKTNPSPTQRGEEVVYVLRMSSKAVHRPCPPPCPFPRSTSYPRFASKIEMRGSSEMPRSTVPRAVATPPIPCCLRRPFVQSSPVTVRHARIRLVPGGGCTSRYSERHDAGICLPHPRFSNNGVAWRLWWWLVSASQRCDRTVVQLASLHQLLFRIVPVCEADISL